MKKLFVLLVIIALVSCKKKNAEPTYAIKYHCYSEGTKAKFNYVDANGNWQTPIIVNHTLDIAVNLPQEDLEYGTFISSTGKDSVFLSADCNGKHLQNSYRCKDSLGTMRVPINIIDFK